jgi:F-type H+-transporting ATPase subunit epsilon
VTGGVIEVLPDSVTILADASEHVSEIDVDRAEEARRKAREFLEKGPPPDTDTYLKMEAALRRSNLRLELVNQFRKRGQRARPPGMGTTSS